MKDWELGNASIVNSTIIVNAREFDWVGKTISFEQLVMLAFENCTPNSSMVFTVTYSKGSDKKTAGSLVMGDIIDVKNKMVFNVTATSQS